MIDAEVRGLGECFDISTPGRRTFSLYRRETGSRVDHIWLTTESVEPVKGTASIPMRASSLFIVP